LRWAGDGHAIAQATHDSRNGKDAHSPVHAIYKLDLRTGWAGFIDLVRPTAAGVEHEITTLRRQDKDQLRCGAAKGKSTLMVYDKAVVDFRFAYNLKQSKRIHAIAICIAHNLLRLFGAQIEREEGIVDLLQGVSSYKKSR